VGSVVPNSRLMRFGGLWSLSAWAGLREKGEERLRP
jgi:hypothetical protein